MERTPLISPGFSQAMPSAMYEHGPRSKQVASGKGGGTQKNL